MMMMMMMMNHGVSWCVCYRAAKESTMENDVGTVKKSRAASPAPKTSKAKEDKEVVKPSPSAEKVPKVEKSSETKTDKARATAGCLCFNVF